MDEIKGTAPSHWAVYFINGDASDMTDKELDAANLFAMWLGGHIVDCADAGFIHRHDAYQFYPYGSDCQTYIALIQEKTQ